MAKKIYRILDDLSPSEAKLRNLPRKPDGLYNMHLNEYGQLVKRAGYAKHNTDAILPANGSKIAGMHRYYKQDLTKKFLVAWYKKIYELPDNGGTAVALTDCPDLGPNADTYFADFLNTCYIVNGVNGVFKYNANGFGSVGITKPATPTVSLTGSGSSLGVGNYRFCYTYIDDDGYESNPSDVSNSVTITAAKEKVTVPLSGTTYKKNVYRTSVNGAIYYFDEGVDKATTSFLSTRADNTLGDEVKYDHTAPEATSHLITKRREKLYIAYNDYLYPSHTSDVEYFPPLWRLRTGNSQKITGLLEQLTALPVFTDDSVERLVGTDEDNFEFQNSYSTEGNIAIRSLVDCDNLLVYLGFNGIFYFDGTTSGIFSQALNKYIKDNINYTYAHLSCATYWDDKYILCYPNKNLTGSTVPNESIYVDLKSKTFGIYSYAFSCFSLWNRGTDGLRLFGGSNAEGRVYEIAGLTDYNETTEKDVAIACYDSPEPIDLGIPDIWKQWFNIYIKVKTTLGTALTMNYTLDDGTETSATSQPLIAGKTLWYKFDLGGGGQRARAIKIRPYVSDTYDVTFMGYAFVFDLEAPEY